MTRSILGIVALTCILSSGCKENPPPAPPPPPSGGIKIDVPGVKINIGDKKVDVDVLPERK